MTTGFLTKGLATGLAVALMVSACDFEVVNPGPVQDGNLNFTAAHEGLVNGAIRATQAGFGNYGYTGGVVTRESMPSGHTGSSGTEPQEEVALLDDQYSGRGSFGDLHNGRWIAEEALRRFDASEETDINSYLFAAQAHFWAGMATRTLGENACTAVFDGGGPQAKLDYFTQPGDPATFQGGAIYHFTEAARIANAVGDTDLATAAIGARAAAYLFVGDMANARTDAQSVPFDFEYATQYSGFGSEFWYTAGAVESLAFQSISLWGTPAEPHFLDTGDSRVAWGYDNGTLEIPAGATKAVRAQTHPARNTWTALIPMYYPMKGYAPRQSTPTGGIIRELRIFEPVLSAQRATNFNIVDGHEMDLIEAETYLAASDVATAMTLINNVRTAAEVYPADLSVEMDLTLHVDETIPVAAGDPLFYSGTPGDFSAGGNMPAVTAAGLDEAWAALKFERYLEMHLEGRRLGDRWRWRSENRPGALRPQEFVASQLATRYGVPQPNFADLHGNQLNLCFPLPRGENDANDNIPVDFQDWIDP